MKPLLIKLVISILGAIIIFTFFLDSKFYGFEYEDSFVNSYIATQSEYSDFVKNYRTEGCNKYYNSNCEETTSFTGHYFPYSLYLNTVNRIFKLKSYQIHKVGNAILSFFLILTLLSCFKKIRIREILFILSILSCLPFIYVFNSSLIENLSLALGTLIISLIYINRKQKQKNIVFIILILMVMITLVKRENLFYLILVPLVLTIKDIKNYKFIIPILLLISTQILINPFFTEYIESEHINRSTFSFDYFLFQFPTYLRSLISIDGFLPFILLIFISSKASKISIYYLFAFFGFIILYSFHYRSQFAIIEKNISLFDTYRYLVNTSPFLFGYFLFSKERSVFLNRKIFYIPFVLIILYFSTTSFNKFGYFIEDEEYNYHLINEKIKELESDNFDIYILDNFNLISLLNSPNTNILELNYENLDGLIHIEKRLKENDKIYLINRFEATEMKEIIEDFLTVKIDSISTNSTQVYEVIRK
jgi:hypothetical protein